MGLGAGRVRGRPVVALSGQRPRRAMAAALAIAADQDDADVEPGKRGNQRDTFAQ